MLNSKKPWQKKVNTKTNNNDDDDDDDIDDDYENQKSSSRRSLKNFKPLSQSDNSTTKSLGTGTYRSKNDNNVNNNDNINENENETITNRRQRSCSACNYIFAIISICFISIFLYCSFYYYNNKGPKWLLFTYSHAFIGLLSIISRIFCCGYCERTIVVYIAWTGLFWSFVYIILSTIDYKQSLTEQGQAASFTIYYTNVINDKDSAALDMCLSLFGTLNCCYHITLYYCFPISSSSSSSGNTKTSTTSATSTRKK